MLDLGSSSNLLDFGDTVPPQPVLKQQEPLVDLFGDSNPVTPSTTQQSQLPTQSLDPLSALIPNATPLMPVTASNPSGETFSTPIGDGFAPAVASSAAPSASGSSDPFDVFMTPQQQTQTPNVNSFPDPFAAFSDSTPAPAQKTEPIQPSTAKAEITPTATSSEKIPTQAQSTIVQNGDTEKKDHTPPIEAAEAERLAKEEADRKAKAVEAERLAKEEAEKKAKAAEKERLAKEEADRKAKAAEAERLAKEEADRKVKAAETERLAKEEADRKAKAAEAERLAKEEADRKAKEAETERLVKEEADKKAKAAETERLAKEEAIAAPSSSSTATIENVTSAQQTKALPTENAEANVVGKEKNTLKEAADVKKSNMTTPPRSLSTATKSLAKSPAKSPTLAEKKAAIVANRFGNFKNMTGNTNRFAGFKSMAGNIAAKGAESMAKVKDQMQKEEVDGPRFSGFKNMAENIAAKGAERVAKVKDQMQKEETDGQNTKRFSGLKNMADNIAAKSKSVAANAQASQQFSAPKMSLFGKGRIDNMLSLSKHGSKHGSKPALTSKVTQSVAAGKQTPSSTTNGTASGAGGAPKPTKAVSKHPTKPSTSSSAPVAASKDASSDLAGSVQRKEVLPKKQSAATDAQTGETNSSGTACNTAGQNAENENIEVPSLSSEAQQVSTTVQENNTSKPITDTSEKGNSVDMAVPVSTEKSSPSPKKASESSETVNQLETSNSTKESVPKGTDETIASDKIVPPTNQENCKTDTSSSETRSETSTVSKTVENGKPQPIAFMPLISQPPSDQVAVLQKELHAAHTLIMQLQHHENVEDDRPGDAVMVELQANLQKEMTRRAEAENKARVAITKSQRIEEEYTTVKKMSKGNLEELTASINSLKKEKDAMEKEVVQIREERDEQARKEMALTTRLNTAKKKEATKVNAAEHFEDQVNQLELVVQENESQIESLTKERNQLKVELGKWKEYADRRTKQLEKALNHEKKLNNERKQKMRGFVETKTEEVRSVKVDYMSLQTELDQNSFSLTELNQRYKQLHAQWVQLQTRNRELQRDAMKMKKDSEKMHKVGGSLEARLSRSAQQSEDHKNKRIHARNELMSVLGQLEAERAVNTRLQDSIKMTLTPMALSQQQTVQEALDEFEGALQKLSIRIGRPLPPKFSSESSPLNENNSFDGGSTGLSALSSGDSAGDGGKRGTVTLSEINSNKAIQKLENETQLVTQNIAKLSTSIECMHNLLDGGGTKSCVDVFSQLLMTGNTPAIAASTTRQKSGQRYGQI